MQLKPIPLSKKYAASDCGKIISYHGSMPKVLKCTPDNWGYPQAGLYSNGKRKCVAVHLLVWLSWIGPIEKGLEVNHIDGDKTNNKLNNLELVTRLQNQRHAIALGIGVGKLSVEQATQIKSIYAKRTHTQQALAELYGVHRSTISLIVRNMRWA